MKIYRDGKEFELTFTEIIQAHEEYELECAMDDVESIYEQGEYGVDLSDEQIKDVARRALRNLNKNDSYYESYWLTVEYTLDQYVKDMEG